MDQSFLCGTFEKELVKSQRSFFKQQVNILKRHYFVDVYKFTMIKFLRSLGKLSARSLPAVTHGFFPRPHHRVRMPPKTLLAAAKFMVSTSKIYPFKYKFSIGVITFDELAEALVFVDKTKFLFDLLVKDSNHKFYAFTRPRMSGKKLQLSMLRLYLSIDVDENGKPKIQSTRYLRKQLVKMSKKQLGQMNKLLCKHLRALAQGETQKGIDKKTQNLSQDDLRKDIREKMKQFVHLKIQSKELIGLILSKIEGMREDYQATFIESVIEMKKFRQLDVQELMVFLFKVRVAKETSATVTDEEKIEIENKFNKIQEKEINYSLSRIVSMIKEELRQRKDKQGWLRTVTKLLETLPKRVILQLLDQISKKEDWEEYIKIINKRLSLKAQKEERQQIGSSISQLKQVLEKTLKRLISKQIDQNGKLEQKIINQLRKDEADVMIIKKKKAKLLFYDCRMEQPLEISKALSKRQYESNLSEIQAENVQTEGKTNSKPEYAIYKQAELEHVGEYPVIYLEMPDLRGFSTAEQMKNSIKMAISKAYKQHTYLVNDLKQLISNNENSSAIKQLQKFQRILQMYGTNSTSQDIQTSLTFLSQLLHRYFGNKAILLINGLDRPFWHLAKHEQRVISEVQPYLTKMIGNAAKSSDQNIWKIISTGITNVVDTDTSSGFNNQVYYSIEDNVDDALNRHFGFTQQQVNDLTRKTLFGPTTKEKNLTAEGKKILIQQLQRIKGNCNGYWIGKTEIYNPWSVINCLKTISIDRDEPFTGGWPQTGSIQIIKQLILKYANQNEVTNLLLLPEIKMEIKSTIHLREMYSFKGLFYLLYFCGYLTRSKDNEGAFRFPNKQIKDHFYGQIMKDWIYQTTNGIESSQWVSLVRSLVQNVTNNSEIQNILELFLSSEVQRNEQSKKRQKKLKGKEDDNDMKKIKLTELELALQLFLSFEWYQQNQQNFYIPQIKMEYPTQPKRLVDMYIIPSLRQLDTAVTLEFKLVPSTIESENQQKQADKMLQQAFWRILANEYLLNAARQCQKRENVKNLQITAIVGHSKDKVWIESYAFTKEKGLQLAECVERFVKKEGKKWMELHRKKGQDNSTQEKQNKTKDQNSVRKELIQGSNDEKLRKQLMQEINKFIQSNSSKKWTGLKDSSILKEIVAMFDIKERHQILKNSTEKVISEEKL